MLLFLGFTVAGASMIAYVLRGQFLFYRHKRQGQDALRRRDYHAAVHSLRRAEAFWDIRAIRHGRPVTESDLKKLAEVLDWLDVAARAGGIRVALREYRQALDALLTEVQHAKTHRNHAQREAHLPEILRLKKAQDAFRKQWKAKKMLDRGHHDCHSVIGQ